MKQTNPFYKSKKWKRKRESILKRDDYECRECRRYGKVHEANTVHHINTLEDRPELALLDDNLISLCNTHHEKMHERMSGELTALGCEWIERVKDKVNPPT
ncbi:HNH endonuclease [Anaerobacillus sp. MEB173]|uniref:HNH endonuclease n=1 Tax=Anaerobacillus sp. MEB173 TaxID=3383345 RepID=UPI003F8E392E